MPLLPLDTLNWFIAFGAVVMEVAAVGIIALLYFQNKNQTAKELSTLVRQFALSVGLIVSVLSLVISLYYSEALGFVPCSLCWLIRVFSYPLVLIFGMAIWKKDHRIWDYVILLSLAGLCVGVYQHIMQLGGSGSLPCPASGPGADCAKRILFEFGHVTFPWVAVAMFGLLIAIGLHARRNPASEN